MRPPFEEIREFLHRPDPVSTQEIIVEFRARGYKIDWRWFRDNIAPALIEEGAEYTVEMMH